MIERDLKFLLAVLNWAVKSRDERGELLLGSNPLKGLKTPTEKNPTRVMLTEEEYRVLLHMSLEMDWRFHVALVLAHETGHRIGAIRQLRWSDVDLECGVVRWRAEHDKSGYEHRTPVTAEALAALEEGRKRNPGIGDAPVLPSPQDRSRCVSCSWTQRWWEKAVALAGLESKRGRGWLSFTHPSMGLAVKTHLPHAPSAHFLTVGVRMVWIARSTTQGGEGCARRVRIAVRKTFTAVAFSALEREPSFYLGLCGPSLRSALQGCIAFEWGLGLSAPAHGVYGCCPL